LKDIKKIVLLGIITLIVSLFFLIKTNEKIKEGDACLCAEILNKKKFLDNKNKMPSVKNCINSFKDFENAHLKCIQTIKFDLPESNRDSLKSV
jgi:hypothetical protein